MNKIDKIKKYREYVELWLNNIAFSNLENEAFTMHIEEIISRLDGLEVFIYECEEEKE